ncbi:MAG: PDZ domain-containing protein [Blastocatellia bacterium]
MEKMANYGRYKMLFSILAVVLFIWGAFGAMEITKASYTGYTISPDNVVTQVRAGSPAETAGVRVGDKVTKIDGDAVESVAGFYERGRAAVDSAGSLAVMRDGVEQTLPFKYAAQPTADMLATSGAGALIGLAFLILGLMAYLKNPTRLSTIFCALSLMLALLFLPGPYFAAAGVRRVTTAIIALIVGAMLATLLYYCLNFPRVKEVLASRPWLRQAIFIVAPLLGLVFALVNLAAPNISAGNSMLLNYVVGVIYGGYFLLAVIGVIHSYVKSGAVERGASGLNLMLLGVVIGFVPLLISILYHTILPHAGDLPGERFWGVTWIAVPICLALALMKLEPAAAAAKAGEEATT